MSFQVFLHPKAVKSLQKLDRLIRDEIKKKLKELEKQSDAGKRLRYSNFWSLRAGDFRVIYEIDRAEKRVIVLFIEHRKKVYDDFSRVF